MIAIIDFLIFSSEKFSISRNIKDAIRLENTLIPKCIEKNIRNEPLICLRARIEIPKIKTHNKQT